MKQFVSEDPKQVGVKPTWEISALNSKQDYHKAFIYTADAEEEIVLTGALNGEKVSLEPGKIYELAVIAGNEKIISTEDNPYKDVEGKTVLPFVLYSKDHPVDRLLNFSSGNDVRDLNINIALNLIHVNQLIKYQAYKQLVITTENRKNIPDPLVLDAATAVVLETKTGSADAEVLDLQAAIDKLWDLIKDRIQLVLTNYGISPQNFTMSAQPQSGFAAMISNISKLEFREAQVPHYRKKEKELFEKVRTVWNYHNTGKRINEKAEFQIDFAEIEFPKTTQEEAEKFTFLKNNNAMTSVDLIMLENPDLTREQAEELYLANKAFNETQNAFQPLQQPAEEEGV
jgi:hypothetical protein